MKYIVTIIKKELYEIEMDRRKAENQIKFLLSIRPKDLPHPKGNPYSTEIIDIKIEEVK